MKEYKEKDIIVVNQGTKGDKEAQLKSLYYADLSITK